MTLRNELNMTEANGFAWLSDVPIEIEVAAVGPKLRMSEILGLTKDSVVATNLRAGENIGLFAGNARIGCGEFSTNQSGATLRIVRLEGRK